MRNSGYLNAPRKAAQWLLKQPPGPVLSLGSSSYTSAFLRFYLHAEDPAVSPAFPRLHLARAVNNEALDIVARW